MRKKNGNVKICALCSRYLKAGNNVFHLNKKKIIIL